MIGHGWRLFRVIRCKLAIVHTQSVRVYMNLILMSYVLGLHVCEWAVPSGFLSIGFGSDSSPKIQSLMILSHSNF